MPNAPNELVSLEGANAETETEAPSAEAEKVAGDPDLLDDQEENPDATDIIGADIEKEDI